MSLFKYSNSLLTAIASLLIVYITVVSIGLLSPSPKYKPQTLGDETTSAKIIQPTPSPSSPIVVDITNTKLMANSDKLYETDVTIKTTTDRSVGFWYQGPNNPYGTSVFEGSTVALKKDHTFHISALPAGTYEYFAVSFDNQNQKTPYMRYPEVDLENMYIGVTPPSTSPKTATVSTVSIKNVLASDIKADDSTTGTYKANISFSTNYDTQATIYIYGPAYPDGVSYSTPRTELAQTHTISLKGLYKGSYEYYIQANSNPTDQNTPSARYPTAGYAKFEIK